MEWEDAVKFCEEIISVCHDVPEKGEEFAFSVMTTVESMKKNIEEFKNCTKNQLKALKNMDEGISRWIK